MSDLGLPRILRADGTAHDPSDCGDCGISDRAHCQRWTNTSGWHRWIAPTDEQVLGRMLARRAARGLCMNPGNSEVLAAATARTHTTTTALEG